MKSRIISLKKGIDVGLLLGFLPSQERRRLFAGILF